MRLKKFKGGEGTFAREGGRIERIFFFGGGVGLWSAIWLCWVGGNGRGKKQKKERGLVSRILYTHVEGGREGST